MRITTLVFTLTTFLSGTSSGGVTPNMPPQKTQLNSKASFVDERPTKITRKPILKPRK